jgi:hypothetical protein
MSEKAERLMKNVSQAFPTCPSEVLNKLSVPQLMGIIQFTMETLEDSAEKNVAGSQNQK